MSNYEQIENNQLLNESILTFIECIDTFIEKKKQFLNRRENYNRNFNAENETLNRLHYFINNDIYNCLLEIRIYYNKIKQMMNHVHFNNLFNFLKEKYTFNFENNLIINVDRLD